MTAKAKDKYTPRLQRHYEEVILPELMKKFGYTNRLQAARLDKIVINMGVGEAVNDSKKTKNAAEQLTPEMAVFTEEEKQEFLACAGTFRRLLSKLESGGRAK